MEPKLYWWMLYANTSSSTDPVYWNETVVDIHPFTAAKILDKQLINYKLVTEKEYKLFNQLKGNKDE
jgi:hypothetical protein